MSDATPDSKLISASAMWKSVGDIIRMEGQMRIEQVRERNLLRANLAHWEVAELFQHLMPIALFEAKEAEDFEEFEAVLRPQIGEEASAWLPSLYLAVAASPTIHYDARMKMVLSVLPFVTDYSG